MTPATITERRVEQIADKTAFRPFRFEASDAELDEMRRRITATRLPEKDSTTGRRGRASFRFMQMTIDAGWREVAEKALEFAKRFTKLRATAA